MLEKFLIVLRVASVEISVHFRLFSTHDIVHYLDLIFCLRLVILALTVLICEVHGRDLVHLRIAIVGSTYSHVFNLLVVEVSFDVVDLHRVSIVHSRVLTIDTT